MIQCLFYTSYMLQRQRNRRILIIRHRNGYDIALSQISQRSIWVGLHIEMPLSMSLKQSRMLALKSSARPDRIAASSSLFPSISLLRKRHAHALQRPGSYYALPSSVRTHRRLTRRTSLWEAPLLTTVCERLAWTPGAQFSTCPICNTSRRCRTKPC
jgi:hypothetical protein